MNIEKLEETIRDLTRAFDAENFIFDLLLAYELPQASITRLRSGNANLGKDDCDVLAKNRVCYSLDRSADLHGLVDRLKSTARIKSAKPRFVIVTDGEILLASDTQTNDTLETPLRELSKHFDFFLPWAGMEKSQIRNESAADIRAAEKMGRLYDWILESNPPRTDEERHSLNVFLSRLLFCFFAEDTRIFEEDQFTKAIDSHTAVDGGDLQQYLTRLFRVLAVEDRDNLPKYLSDFPYVNGGLFCEEHPVPNFDSQSRKIILDCGSLNWRDINPDIFGSMIQAVVHTNERGNLGIHYTSVLNIMKVIEPLFLDDLRAELEKAGSNRKKLEALLERLYRIRVFDPACGSGNFLIIAYKELSKLEIAIFKRIYGDQQSFQFESKIQLTQFYGIEIDGFAAETAKLSLWLAEHQMNLAFESVFGAARPTLPLHDGGHIVCGNATKLEWTDVCPKAPGATIFVIGNPPYLGSRNQDAEQKDDMKYVFGKEYKSLDYVSCWFHKASSYINGFDASYAFVSTNSICQGEQVGLLWPRVLSDNLEIHFAHTSFKWTNNAKGNAGVTVIVVAVRNASSAPKRIIQSDRSEVADNISPYLVNAKTVYVHSRNSPQAEVPRMNFGNMPADGGQLLFTTSEKNLFLEKEPEAEQYFRKLISAREFLNGQERWCLWLQDVSDADISELPLVRERVDKLRDIRKESSRPQLAETPHLFAQITQPAGQDFVLIPRHSSEHRDYIPMGYFDKDNIAHDSCLIVCGIGLSYFGILHSAIHMTWTRAVAGRIKTDYRYSAALCYNTFPFPEVDDDQKTALEECVLAIFDTRESHSEKTLAQLYDPSKMPEPLRRAHADLDSVVEKCFRSKAFTSDEDRLEFLLTRYTKSVGKAK
ncbi:class I SAM-dependent DNA methyltransferase [Rhodopirellula europaea]|uniref:class I SAM-dependent DNA methyltransferase n=1 Tax=Rhodopirellula europaea TaxID=1263866 RepID=UPI003D2BE2DF|tara:strand:+ start:108373 stop:111006 length:2634 start_codon:yes stop_codon:yes gene_type:complete